MLQKKYKAAGVLLLSIAGFVLSYPYHEGFWGGLIYSGCLAAVIGGLADWFAVTALFRKPLGISYRTEVIPRNRERIFGEIIAFTGRDLLNPENMMKIAGRYDMAEMAILYLEDAEGKEKIKALAARLRRMLLEQADPEEIGKMVGEAVKGGLNDVQLATVLLNGLRWSVENRYDENVIQFLLNELIWITGEQTTHDMLCDMIAEVKAQYEGAMMRRQFVSLIFDLSSQRLADLAQRELIQYLERMKNQEHPLRIECRAWIAHQIDRLENSDAYHNLVEEWKNERFGEEMDIAPRVAAYVERWLRPEENGTQLVTESEIDRWINRKISAFKTNPQLQKSVDEKIKSYVSLLVHEQHAMITKIVRDRLNEFSDTSLVSFIESRVADDLQMIRINGSLVGAAAGMFLYLITCFAERVG